MADFTAGQVLTAAQLDAAFNTFTINTQTGTTYTLGAADAGEMVTINNNSGGTVTIPTNATTAFATGTHISILNNGTAGTFTVVGAGGVTFTSDVTTLPPRAAITVVKTATNTWYGVAGGAGKASVSGTTGSPTVDTSSRPGKTIYTFNGSGSITVSTAGLVEVLLVAGGGGGGQSTAGSVAGGGGAGGGHLSLSSAWLSAGTHTVTVGGGGANRAFGSPSIVGPYAAAGGAPGRSNGTIETLNGGSGGGGAGAAGAAGSGITGQGNNGGAGANSGGGGGGGGGAVGSAASVNNGGNGGAGASNSITGSAVTRAGGGGGGRYSTGTAGSAGSGGGGAGGADNATAGTANTGGGGGGNGIQAGSAGTGASGGSGVVIVVVD